MIINLNFISRKKKKQRLLKKLKASTSQKSKRPDPPVKQRTSIVIIKADESDEEKREVNVTQQMSEMHMDVDSHGIRETLSITLLYSYYRSTCIRIVFHKAAIKLSTWVIVASMKNTVLLTVTYSSNWVNKERG